MSDEQILFLYKAFKCQGENGFAGDAFALTSASGILLKPDPAWPERGPGGAQRAGRSAGGGPAAGFRCRRVQKEFAPKGESSPPLAPVFSDPLPKRVGPWQSPPRPPEQALSGVAWILWLSWVRGEAEPGAGGPRGSSEPRDPAGRWPATPRLQEGNGERMVTWKVGLPLFTVGSKPQKCLPLFCCC